MERSDNLNNTQKETNDFEGKKRKAGNDIFEEVKGNQGGKSRTQLKKEKLEKRNQKKIQNDLQRKENQDEDKGGWLKGKTFEPKRDLKSEKFEVYYRVRKIYIKL
jgi:hypothetical protein